MYINSAQCLQPGKISRKMTEKKPEQTNKQMNVTKMRTKITKTNGKDDKIKGTCFRWDSDLKCDDMIILNINAKRFGTKP